MRPRTGLSLAVLAAFCLQGCASPDGLATTQTTHARTAVLLDYSPTVSDVGALLYLASRRDVDLVAVTVVGTGEAHCATAVPYTAFLLEQIGHVPVPIACGDESPVGAGRDWPEAWRDAADGLAPSDLAPVATPEGGAAALIASAADRTDDLVVITLGPMTNLADALARHPDLAHEVAMVFTMGGAFAVPGNVPDGAAEWNLAVDSAAVDRVVRSGMPLTIVPLDATDVVPAAHGFAARLAAAPAGSPARVLGDLWADASWWEGPSYLWDELTAVLAVEPSLATFASMRVAVDVEGPDAGRTSIDSDGAEVLVAANPDRRSVEDELLAALAAGPVVR